MERNMFVLFLLELRIYYKLGLFYTHSVHRRNCHSIHSTSSFEDRLASRSVLTEGNVAYLS